MARILLTGLCQLLAIGALALAYSTSTESTSNSHSTESTSGEDGPPLSVGDVINYAKVFERMFVIVVEPMGETCFSLELQPPMTLSFGYRVRSKPLNIVFSR